MSRNMLKAFRATTLDVYTLKRRYQAGKKAFEAIKTIERLKNENIKWSDTNKPLGRVDSKHASTSASSPPVAITQNDFKSRDKAFKDALKFLQQDDEANQVIALWGMGGVGKTTMMEQLKKVAHDNKKFDWIAKVAIGQKPDMLLVQNDIAKYMGVELSEGTKTLKADHLCKSFEILSQEKKKILVILDDVWENIELKDIGLTSPLPNGVKLLLTSRKSDICRQIAACVNSQLQLVEVNVLEEGEAQTLFFEIAKVSQEGDQDLYKIGCEIVKKCGYLPLAIKLLASALQSKEKCEWSNTSRHLKNNVIDDPKVQEIIKLSYDYMKEKEEQHQIFLHCGFFPEDTNISIEDLVRQAWGLKLFRNISSLKDAREETNTCVHNLINANLLMNGDAPGFVKLHDLVLTFVLDEVSNGDHAWIIDHGNVSKREIDEMAESCQRLSLTCTDMSEFPTYLKYPNLSLLQLRQGHLLPEDFYKNMEKLEVIACYDMEYPSLLRSLHCSENLKSLCLHRCSLNFDLSFVGDLVNLEVLSFARCEISKLPSTVGNLRKLKLLDLTGCNKLHIDDGVFRNLKNLEELYLNNSNSKDITQANFEELKMISSNLCALEVEFVKEIEVKNMNFNKLDKFMISMGCLLEEERYAFINTSNTLKLEIVSCNELRDSKINELFEKTAKLYLEVEDMVSLKNVSYNQHSFSSLTDLVVSYCAKLKYLFPISMASGLRKLERLKISSCSVLEALIDNDGSEISSVFEHSFSSLRDLVVSDCDYLKYLFPVSVASGLRKLERLKILSCPVLETLVDDDGSEISSVFEHSFSSLIDLEVTSCDKLRYLFTISVANGLRKLERLEIWYCSVLETLVNDDGSEISSVFEHSFFSLRNLKVSYCDKLKYLFPISMASGLRKLERLKISSCSVLEAIVDKDGSEINSVLELPQLVKLQLVKLPNFISIYPHRKNNSVVLLNSQVKIPGLKKLTIRCMEKLKHIWSSEIGSEEEVNKISKLSVEDCKSLENLFPTNPMPLFNNLEELNVESCGSLKEIFNIDLECIRKDEQLNSSKSRLRSIVVDNLENLTEVWRIKGGENNSSLLIGGFEAVENIHIISCERFKYVFKPTNTKFDLRALTIIKIRSSMFSAETNGIDMSTIAFPSSNLMHSFSNLHELQLYFCNGVEVVFDVESRTDLVTPASSLPRLLPNLQHLSLYFMERMSHVWNWSNFLVLQNQSSFHKLTTIYMYDCNRIKYLFSPLMAKLLSNLKKIEIQNCDGIEELVSSRDDKDEDKYDDEEMTNFFPHLQSISFKELKKLERIDGGGGDRSITQSFLVRVVSLSLCQNSREILLDQCESLTEVFETQGINNESGGDTTSTNIHERNGVTNIPRLEKWNVPQKFNLKKLVITYCKLLKHVFMFSTLESLRQLEELKVQNCHAMEVIVKEENVERRKVVEFSCLKTLSLVLLPNLKGFFLGINEFKWPLLENVTIRECPKMKVFTCGASTTSKLKYMHTSFHTRHVISSVTTLHQTTLPSSSSERSSLSSTTLEELLFSFHNLIEIHVEEDNEVQCVIPSNELRQLQKLERIRVYHCHWVKEVFEVEAMEMTNSESPTIVSIPNLTQLELDDLFNFKYIWNSNHHQRTTLAFPNLTTLSFTSCYSLEHVFTRSMVGSLLQLKDLSISYCSNLKLIFKEEESGSQTKAEIPNLRQVELKFLRNLTTLSIDHCYELEHVFTNSMIGSLQKLQHLHIDSCLHMKVIVKEEEEASECDSNVKQIVLPCLKSMNLKYLDSLKGFCLGKNDFSCPSLDTLQIMECPSIKVFTMGHLDSTALKLIDTKFARCYVRGNLNSFIQAKRQEGYEF